MKTIYLYPYIDNANTGINRKTEYFVDYVIERNGRLKPETKVFTDKTKAKKYYEELYHLAMISS